MKSHCGTRAGSGGLIVMRVSSSKFGDSTVSVVSPERGSAGLLLARVQPVSKRNAARPDTILTPKTIRLRDRSATPLIVSAHSPAPFIETAEFTIGDSVTEFSSLPGVNKPLRCDYAASF